MRYLTVALVLCLAGCASLNPTPPIEAFANKLADEAIIPAVKAGIADGVKNLSLSANAQGINPTYVVKFEGLWVTGIQGKASVGVEGVAGTIGMNAAGATEGVTEPKPATSEKPTVISDTKALDAAVAKAAQAAADAEDAASRANEDAKDAQDSAAAAKVK